MFRFPFLGAIMNSENMVTDTTKEPEMPSRFFALPRELRDLVYYYLLQDLPLIKTHQTGDGTDTIRLSASSAPRKCALTICRQFCEEYSDSLKHAGTLHITDFNKDFPDSVELPRKHSLSLVKKVDMRLLASCSDDFCSPSGSNDSSCYVSVNINRHRNWLRTLAPALQHVTDCRIKLYIWGLSRTEGCLWPNLLPQHAFGESLEKLLSIELSGLKEVEVWFGKKGNHRAEGDGCRNMSWEDLTDLKLYGRWRAGSGWDRGAKESSTLPK